MKVSEAIDIALDYMVAIAPKSLPQMYLDDFVNLHAEGRFHFSTDWSVGGPIIEREKITVQPVVNPDGWMARTQRHESVWGGPTPLIAAMRCYVASKLGDEVEVPEELL